MKEKFLDHRFGRDSLSILDEITAILDEYEALGFDLSLRQLYYQLIARDVLPASWEDDKTGSKNSQGNYKRIGNLVNDARLAGLIDWEMIQDRNRETVSNAHWDSPAQIVNAAANQFRIDKWADQPVHIEAMVEKDALSGVLIPVCRELDIRFTANKGYSSSSMLYEVGQRIRRQADIGKTVHILYMGDHDPSGIDMTRDVQERLELFSGYDIFTERLALNMEQVEVLRPPENPAKTTDSRAAAYIRRFGESSWELDAVEPRALAGLVTQAVEALRDEALWEAAVSRENQMRGELLSFARTYETRNRPRE